MFAGHLRRILRPATACCSPPTAEYHSSPLQCGTRDRYSNRVSYVALTVLLYLRLKHLWDYITVADAIRYAVTKELLEYNYR
jgi:hypothetical protein